MRVHGRERRGQRGCLGACPFGVAAAAGGAARGALHLLAGARFGDKRRAGAGPRVARAHPDASRGRRLCGTGTPARADGGSLAHPRKGHRRRTRPRRSSRRPRAAFRRFRAPGLQPIVPRARGGDARGHRRSHRAVRRDHGRGHGGRCVACRHRYRVLRRDRGLPGPSRSRTRANGPTRCRGGARRSRIS